MLETMSLRIKLLLLSGLAIATLLCIAATGIIGIRSSIASIRDIGQQRLPSVIAIQALKEAQVALKSSTFEAGLWENDTDAQDQFAAIGRDKQQLAQKVDAAWKAYEAIPRSAQETALWQRFTSQWNAWKKIDDDINRLIAALAANHDAARQSELFLEYFRLGGQQRAPYAATEKLLGELVDLNAATVRREAQSAEHATRIAQHAMIAAGLAATLLLGVLSFLVTRSILRQMGGDPSIAASVTRAVAAGNLCVEIPLSAGDNTSLLASMSFMQRNLRELIGQVLHSARRLAESSHQLTGDVQRVSASGAAESQAAKTTAEAVAEISARVQQIGQAAETAQRLSQQAGALSQQGQAVVNQAASDMVRISQSVNESSELTLKLGTYSTEISAIVNVIKEVADQTNLLALNAAIEAARAGEQGRGFAVVADEVRKLAERTARSTLEITTMISTIQNGVQLAVASMSAGGKQVDGGVQMMSKATATMTDIQAGAQDASRAVDSISDSLRDSTGNLQHIADSMDNIVQLVESSSSSVQTMVDSVAEIEQLAEELASAAGSFQL